MIPTSTLRQRIWSNYIVGALWWAGVGICVCGWLVLVVAWKLWKGCVREYQEPFSGPWA
jgi:hypothetical protein